MRFYHRDSPLLLAVAVAWAVCLADDSLATVTAATSTEWVRETGDPGSWFDSSNWSDGVPDVFDVAEISHGGEINLRRGSAEANLLRLARSPVLPFNTPLNHVRQTGGRLRLHNGLSIDDGRYDLERGAFTTDWVILGRTPVPILPALWTSSEAIILPLDPPSSSPAPREDLERFPDVSILDLSDDILTVHFPEQNFHQSGGRTNIDQRLSIYTGGVSVSGGRLQADSILIDVGSLLLGGEVSGMEQTGGSVRVADELLIQNNSYQLSGGTLRVDRIAIGDPAMESSEITDINRSPEFIQTGGVSHVMGNLELCVPGFEFFPSPVRRFRLANYRLQGGMLAVDGDAIVGSLGEAPVNFLHSAGRALIGGTLRIEGDSSRYEFSGGRLSTENLEIGLGIFNTGGAFAITEPAPARGWLSFLRSEQVTVHNRISLGEESVFEAVPGSRMRLAGEKFENFSTHDENLAGLNNLELIIGDTIWNLFRASTAPVTEFEVGGLDLGNVDEGYVENFALDTLRVGGLRPAHLRLVDLVDNQLDSGSPEALYVDHLVVGRGSTLDLGGIPIYYRTARIFGSVINAAQVLTSISQVPEPASALLLLVGSAMWTGARKRAGGRHSSAWAC